MIAAPVAAGPEIWLQHGGSWSKNSITFNLNCSAPRRPSGLPVHDQTDPNFELEYPGYVNGSIIGGGNPSGYPASTYILVEARNVEGNLGDQETLPDDHPGRAWGKTMWCQLWGGCQIERPKELDIELTQETPSGNTVTLSDHNSSASGQSIEVTRGANTHHSKKVVSINRLCTTGEDHPGTVTIKARKVMEREL